MRKRTKPRVVWLPPTDVNPINGQAPDSGLKAFIVEVTNVSPNGIAVGEIPLVIDSQDDPLDPATSLADIESSGYRLRRIVGKIFVLCLPSDESQILAVVVTAGLIIRRSNPVDGKSYASLTLDPELSHPAQIPNYGDPWIWRRSWLLGNTDGGLTVPLPPDNLFFSALDGPHVDQKTARIVGPEERLFLNVGITIAETTSPGVGEIPQKVKIFTDLRVLASMRTSSGNRRNASR